MYICMEDSNRAENRPLKLDWDKLLPPDLTDDQPPAVVIVRAKPPHGGAKEAGATATAMEEFLPDHELLERIKSTKRSISLMSHSLLDKGDKLRDSLRRLEAERDKRNLQSRRVETINVEESDGARSASSGALGGSKDSRKENPAPQASSFASIFMKRIDGNKKDWRSNAFDKEMSLLGRCEQQKLRSNNKESSQKRKWGSQSTLRRSPPLKRDQSFSRERGKQVLSNGNENGRAAARDEDIKELFTNCSSKNKKDSLPVSASNDSKAKKGETIVLEDEEDPQQLETLQLLEKPDESMKDGRIYYPSREHPESVEISYSDFDCLAPQAFLKSNIMNFYIRYVQEHISPTNSVMRNCHFFNTYFYDKLKEVLSSKESSRGEFFIKFRRWWKGVNIFHKEYILIPINEDIHWSLVIICIPDKEEDLGPIILHLDSLGLHSSQSVFQNIKSYLIEEWKHLRSEASLLDLPFADHVWEKLSRRIIDNRITVPQQKNDYDCGLFVLYFMERFIEDAPGRLKKKDLAMFGKQWFKPEEASGLRVKIHKLLMQEFKNAEKSTDKNASPPSSPSALHDIVEV